MNHERSLSLAVELTKSWLSNENLSAKIEDVSSFLREMYKTVNKIDAPRGNDIIGVNEIFVRAVSVRKSLASKDHLISMINGKAYRSLRRHISENGLTPEEYRARYKLRFDYPMVSESYSEARRDLAKRIGLGLKPGHKVGKPVAGTNGKAKHR